MDLKILQLLPGDRAVVSTADRFRMIDSVTGETIEDLANIGERDYLVNASRGRVEAISYRELRNVFD